MRIPADVDREDPLVFGLSARQLCILGGAALAAWLAYEVMRPLLPAPLAVAFGAPLIAMGIVIALGRRDGLTSDRFLLAALRQLWSPRRLVPISDGDVSRRALRAHDGARLAAFDPPLRDIGEDGVLDLGREGTAILCRVSPLNFRLRTREEQSALVAAFGRFLNSLQVPIQILVRGERADLGGLSRALNRHAAALPHPALESAALSHAHFLGELSTRHDLLRREVLLAMRAPTEEAAADLVRRVQEASASLAQAGVTASVLSGSEAATTLRRALDPEKPEQAKGDLALTGATVAGGLGGS